jgi:hypothetical protein
VLFVEISQRNLLGDRLKIDFYFLDSVDFRFLLSALISARFRQAEGVSRFIFLSILRLLADHAPLVFAGVAILIAGVWGVMIEGICRAFL